jgi:hypothetical protein
MTREEYEAKYHANTRMSGFGLDTTIHMPCPFCAEPDFLSYRSLETHEALAKETVCTKCGRGMRNLIVRTEHAGSVTVGFAPVQTRGDDPAPYLRWIQREDAASRNPAQALANVQPLIERERAAAGAEPLSRFEVPTKSQDPRRATTDGLPARPGYEDAPAPAPARPDGQHEAYWILSEEERAKGFVRPVRRSYVHVGAPAPKHPLRDLTDEERERYSQFGYVKFEAYPESESPVTGSFWTQARLDAIGKGCGSTTTMGLALAETYARDPRFYGSTFCCACGRHLPVGEAGEFVWQGTDERVGT